MNYYVHSDWAKKWEGIIKMKINLSEEIFCDYKNAVDFFNSHS